MGTTSWFVDAPLAVRAVLENTTFLSWFNIVDFEQKRLPPNITAALRRSGTYLVAVSDSIPADDPLTRAVHYIGMTKGEKTSLASRIGDFAAAARGGDASHSGGHTWHEQKLPPNFWIRVAPAIDLRTCDWATESWSIWPEVVEKALLMSYAHRHGAFPKVNKEGWTWPVVTEVMIASVTRLLRADGVAAVSAACDVLPTVLSAWGYNARKVYGDNERNEPGWFGAEAVIASGYWLWIGKTPENACHVGIWHKSDACWHSITIKHETEIEAALGRLLHLWRTNAGLL